jgi:hypothetical protein
MRHPSVSWAITGHCDFSILHHLLQCRCKSWWRWRYLMFTNFTLLCHHRSCSPFWIPCYGVAVMKAAHPFLLCELCAIVTWELSPFLNILLSCATRAVLLFQFYVMVSFAADCWCSWSFSSRVSSELHLLLDRSDDWGLLNILSLHFKPCSPMQWKALDVFQIWLSLA